MNRQLDFLTPLALLLGTILFWNTGEARADNFHFEDARWRLEMQAGGGAYSGKVDRDDDYYFTGTIEYECPAFERSSFGLRLYPLFVYHEEEDEEGYAHTIYGTAFGITHRIYQQAEDRSGFFAELGSSLLWHSRKFEGNSGRVNFLSEIGIGYKFPGSPWHGSLKWSHLSNGGTSRSNSGVNGVVFTIGYSF